jgi:hypothetical protein
VQEIMNKLELKKEHEHSMGGMSMWVGGNQHKRICGFFTNLVVKTLC